MPRDRAACAGNAADRGRLLRRVADFALVEAGGGKPRTGGSGADAVAGGQSGAGRGGPAVSDALAEKLWRGAGGVETIAAALSEPRDAIEEVIEPYLLQQGLILRTPRGRMLGRRPGGIWGWRRLSCPTL